MKKLILALFAALTVLAVSGAVVFAAGRGDRNLSPTTVAEINASGWDDQRVVLDGKFIEHVHKDIYTFVDKNGDNIKAEIDDDLWYQIKLDEPVRIYAEVDKSWRHGIELEVKHIESR